MLVDTGIIPAGVPSRSWAPVPGRPPAELDATGIAAAALDTVVPDPYAHRPHRMVDRPIRRRSGHAHVTEACCARSARHTTSEVGRGMSNDDVRWLENVVTLCRRRPRWQ